MPYVLIHEHVLQIVTECCMTFVWLPCRNEQLFMNSLYRNAHLLTIQINALKCFINKNKLCSKLFVLTWNLTLVCCRIGFSLLGLLCKTLYRMKTSCIQSVEHNWKIIAFFWETILQFLCQCFILHDKMNLNCLEYSRFWINDILGLCLNLIFFQTNIIW